MSRIQPAIIVLNGASSSGKTLTARALAGMLGPDCIVTGFDDILDRVRPFGSGGDGIWNGLGRNARIIWFQATNGRLRLFRMLHREVVDRYRSGSDVIVETSLMGPSELRDAAACFAPASAFFIGMKPPLDVSERWEAARSDRPRGQARKHYDLIHAHGTYDLVIDTSAMTPDECAAAIIRRLGAPPDAFRTLLERDRA